MTGQKADYVGSFCGHEKGRFPRRANVISYFYGLIMVNIICCTAGSHLPVIWLKAPDIGGFPSKALKKIEVPLIDLNHRYLVNFAHRQSADWVWGAE